MWEQASTMSWVGHDAPPFFVIHGENDSLVPVEQARSFVAMLRAASANPVAYAELPVRSTPSRCSTRLGRSSPPGPSTGSSRPCASRPATGWAGSRRPMPPKPDRRSARVGRRRARARGLTALGEAW
ncbi:MAG: hypothetical protein R2746_08725 [Acidimicrobiales bacterium]